MSTTPKTPTNLGSGQAEATEDKLHSGPEAFDRFKEFTRRILAVPKQAVEDAEGKKGVKPNKPVVSQ